MPFHLESYVTSGVLLHVNAHEYPTSYEMWGCRYCTLYSISFSYALLELWGGFKKIKRKITCEIVFQNTVLNSYISTRFINLMTVNESGH